MKAARFIIAPLLVALCLFAGSHEILEACGVIHTYAWDNPTTTHQDDHDFADGASHMPPPALHLAKFHRAELNLLPALLATIISFDWRDARQEVACLVNPSPPEFSSIWQFSFRTALPARAPSLA